MHNAAGTAGTSRAPRGCIAFTFQHRAHGIDTKGVGNVMQIVVDEATAKVVELSSTKGWSYYTPTTALSSSDASGRAMSLITQHAPRIVSGVRSITRQYWIANEEFGCSIHTSLRESRRIRYAYAVTFDKCIVFIDAGSGESLGGKRGRFL
jgi:hypothetical protein